MAMMVNASTTGMELTYIATSTPVAATISSQTLPISKQWTFDTLIKRLSDKYGVDETQARKIIQCESGNNKDAIGKNYTKDGILWSTDIGYFQLNSVHQKPIAAQQDFDVHLWEENLEWGFKLMKEKGTSPWNASKNCWSP